MFFKGALLLVTPQELKNRLPVVCSLPHTESEGGDYFPGDKMSSQLKQTLRTEIELSNNLN